MIVKYRMIWLQMNAYRSNISNLSGLHEYGHEHVK